jgi:hypothetical protein
MDGGICIDGNDEQNNEQTTNNQNSLITPSSRKPSVTNFLAAKNHLSQR